ncbi:MAG: MAE_28990/MAE_18760 family HEPN-like nuclease [Defluviitaleaceae bacterium]|nr:MAE_28990/MAE_18760 family HEPN-like nuclease [Defluviitaleaceae bacterium]
MKFTRNIYNERIAEINFYYDALDQLDTEIIEDISSGQMAKYKHDTFLKISKSNALLMIYNLVESTVVNGMQEIYDKVKNTGATYSTVREEFQDIWFSYKFGQVYRQPDASYKSYKSKAMEIARSIMLCEEIELSRDALPISGNLDAGRIFKICDDHGIDYKPDKACKCGKRLEDVRVKRNGLAHGNLSFVECGREYTLADLVEIKEQTYIFLSGLLDEMERFYDSEGYLMDKQPKSNLK